MTSEELQAIRERVNKATPGPWELGRKHGESGWSSSLPDGSQEIVSMGTLFALGVDVCAVPFKDTGDGWFIAHAREDVPKLLDMVERLRKALVFIRERVNELTDDVCEEFFLYEIDDAARQALSEAGR